MNEAPPEEEEKQSHSQEEWDALSCEEKLAFFQTTLASLEEDWHIRARTIERVGEWAAAAEDMVAFVPTLHALREALAVQISDRRSRVLKAVAEVVAKAAHSLDRHWSTLTPDQIEQASETLCCFVRALCPVLPVTVKIMATEANECLCTLLKAAHDADGGHKLLLLLSQQCSHKHGMVRSRCYEALPLLLAKWTAHDAQEPLWSRVLECVTTGLRDNVPAARAGARLALIQLLHLQPERVQPIIDGMTGATRHIFDKQLSEHALGATAVGPPSPALKTRPPWKKSTRRRRVVKKKARKRKLVKKRSSHSLTDELLTEALGPAAAKQMKAETETEKGTQDDGVIDVTRARRLSNLKTEGVQFLGDSVPFPCLSESKVSKQESVLAKFLDLDNPMITRRMETYMLQDGVVATFMSFLSRVTFKHVQQLIRQEKTKPHQRTVSALSYCPSPSHSGGAEGKGRTDRMLGSQTRARPTTEEEKIGTRRSFRVMQLICQTETNATLKKILSRRLRHVVLQLLAAFHPAGPGNLFHASQRIVNLLLTREGSLLFQRVVDSVHIGAVPQMFLDVLALPSLTSMSRKLLFKLVLDDCRLMKGIEAVLDDADTDDETVSAVVSFSIQSLERLAPVSEASVFMLQASRPQGVLAKALDVIVQRKRGFSSARRVACSRLVHALLRKTRAKRVVIPAPSPQHPLQGVIVGERVINAFRVVYPALSSRVLASVDLLLRAVQGLLKRWAPQEPEEGKTLETSLDMSLESASPGSVPEASTTPPPVTKPLHPTVLLVAIMDILGELAEGASPADFLSSISPHGWATLLSGFFKLRKNNFFLSRFLNIVLVTVKGENLKRVGDMCEQKVATAAVQEVFERQDLLGRMVKFFLSKAHRSCSLHSYILELCSHLRLRADLYEARKATGRVSPCTPGAFLSTFLPSHAPYQAFLPELRARTLTQANALVPVSKAVRKNISLLTGSAPQQNSPLSPRRSAGGTPPLGIVDVGGTAILGEEKEKEKRKSVEAEKEEERSGKKTPPLTPVRTPREETDVSGIDLGSAFASSRGYVV